MFDHLAIDWGSKRCGLAFGSATTGLVLTANYPCETDTVWYMIEKEITERKITTVIVGRPTNFNGGDTDITKKIDQFIHQLTHKFPTVTVITQNERGTTRESKVQLAHTKDKHSINHQAAARILELYFEFNLKTKN